MSDSVCKRLGCIGLGHNRVRSVRSLKWGIVCILKVLKGSKSVSGGYGSKRDFWVDGPGTRDGCWVLLVVGYLGRSVFWWLYPSEFPVDVIQGHVLTGKVSV